MRDVLHVPCHLMWYCAVWGGKLYLCKLKITIRFRTASQLARFIFKVCEISAPQRERVINVCGVFWNSFLNSVCDKLDMDGKLEGSIWGRRANCHEVASSVFRSGGVSGVPDSCWLTFFHVCLLRICSQAATINAMQVSLLYFTVAQPAVYVLPLSSSYSWLIYFLKSLNEHYGVSYWPLWQFQSTGFTVAWLTRLPPPQRDKTSSDSERVRISSSS